MNVRFIKSSEKKQIEQELNTKLGIQNLPYLLFETGKEKIRAFSGDLSKDELIKLSELCNIEIIGLYMVKKENNQLRLSFDATQLLKDKITKNILSIDEKQMFEWIRGKDLDIKTEPGLFIIEHNGDFIGCGVSNSQKISNYIPKERRLRK